MKEIVVIKLEGETLDLTTPPEPIIRLEFLDRFGDKVEIVFPSKLWDDMRSVFNNVGFPENIPQPLLPNRRT